jgi:deoxycytidylate deaminase
MILSAKVRHNLMLAARIAREKDHRMCWHFGAVIVHGKEVINVGWNSYRTHPKSTAPYKYLHAEMDAIIGVDENKLAGATLFVVRVGFLNRRELMMAQPCEYCRTAIVRAGIHQVYFSVEGTDNMIRKVGIWDVRNDVTRIIEVNEELI